VKKTPERVKRRSLQRESNVEDPSRGSRKEDFRVSQVKKSPVEGGAKKTLQRVKCRRLQ
jgi:hypothetical protein